jgi:hypothetical protein
MLSDSTVSIEPTGTTESKDTKVATVSEIGVTYPKLHHDRRQWPQNKAWGLSKSNVFFIFIREYATE